MSNENDSTQKGTGLPQLPFLAWVGIAVACLVIGLLLGSLVSCGGPGAGLSGVKTVAEEDLDKAVASYTYNGETQDITARDVLQQSGSMVSSNEDGSYTLPSAETALAVARNKIIEKEAVSRGIEVSDADLSDYAEQTLGQSDFAAIAESYNLSEDAVKEQLRNSVLMSRLHDEVVTAQEGDAPSAPEEPAEGEEKTPTKNYADYIFALAGDEWNGEGWASEDGPYASALSQYEITADGASYEAAQAAYYVAYQEYVANSTQISTQWSDFVNDLMTNANVTVYSLLS